MEIFWTIVIGFLAGIVAKLITPGRPKPQPATIAPTPAPLSFSIDRTGLMPWAEEASQTVQNAASTVKQAAAGFFDHDAFMPWKPRAAATTPAQDLPRPSTCRRLLCPKRPPRCCERPRAAKAGAALHAR